MNLLDNDRLQELVDYSFGDHSGVLGGVPQAFMKKANISNTEFLDIVKDKDKITLFIDNIRLYRRPINYSDWLHIKPISISDRKWLDQFEDEDLLNLCSLFPNKKFIIFTAFEDTPLDEFVWSRLPSNVTIHCANGVIFGDRIIPFPHGLERSMYHGYDHQQILSEYIGSNIQPRKLLFVAHRSDTGDRASLGNLFKDKEWATVTHLPYEQYIQGILDHKFVLCPSGNGIESARNWETLYLGRVPVFKDHPYLREMFKDFPAVFVDEFSNVTEQLLLDNEHLFTGKCDNEKLDLLKQFNSRI